MESKILIVDDQKEYLQTAMRYIIEDSIPYALLCAPDGEAGVEIAIMELPDIIIMDWEMPGMNGIDAIKHLKQNLSTKDIPVIMATGIRLSPEDLKTAFAAGASDFIRKPLEKTEFIARISSHLRMANHLKTIKKQEEELAAAAIAKLQEKIQFLQAKSEDDKAKFLFFHNMLLTFREKLTSMNIAGCSFEPEMKALLGQLEQSVRSLKKFDGKIDSPDKNFIHNLLNNHGNLTPQEIQLSYMLKNDLNTKDIATITFREEGSVKVARSRLRKKLQLDEAHNLVTYLCQF